ncbi:MAG: hypothetical protein DRH50_12620 [Deltaproteobacteria bacterium]|nr:MAG: hypothetical protein DRH50_12620 [Deltaproteobacteria bacterium]
MFDRKKRFEQRIALNFLPLVQQDFSFFVYRKQIGVGSENPNRERHNGVRRYRLPQNLALQTSDYVDCDVSFSKIEGFEKVKIYAHTNIHLTKFLLMEALQKKCREHLSKQDYLVGTKFRNTISFVLAKTDVGDETVWLEPYFLKETGKFGFLVGFHFKVKEGIPLNRKILQYSLSIGSDGRENKNYYVDIFKKIKKFISKYHSQLFPFEIGDGVAITISWPMQDVRSEQLDTKLYIFSNEKKDVSQFQGIRKHGPLVPVRDDSLICFMYRPEDKPLSYELYHALKGDKYATFPGMDAMFSFSFGNEHVTGLPLNGYDSQCIDAAIKQLLLVSGDRPVLPLILFPWSRMERTTEGEDCYYRIKHQFLANRLPTQFVSLQRIRGRDGLKWSVANIALAVFGKLGGKPWKLSPKHERCLIIGIGQAHRKDGDKISRYFAYSVLSDSSGLYDSIRILSKSENKEHYLDGLTVKIKEVIAEFSDRFDKFVVHTPFKLKKDEITAITSALDAVQSNKTVVVLKFNEKSKFFGFALGNNSKVPYESSCVALGGKEYLVWFEGLQYHNPTVKRRIARPMHIAFVYSSKELEHADEISYLQDAINLSGANWRGFNAKTLPISVYYAKLIAEYIGHFDRLGLPEIDIEDLPPWFL